METARRANPKSKITDAQRNGKAENALRRMLGLEQKFRPMSVPGRKADG